MKSSIKKKNSELSGMDWLKKVEKVLRLLLYIRQYSYFSNKLMCITLSQLIYNLSLKN